jgi:hypothetical protein
MDDSFERAMRTVISALRNAECEIGESVRLPLRIGKDTPDCINPRTLNQESCYSSKFEKYQIVPS